MPVCCMGSLSGRSGLFRERCKGAEAVISINEFCAIVDIVTERYGKEVMMGAQDKLGHLHLSRDGEHLGYIDITTGSLVWDRGVTEA